MTSLDRELGKELDPKPGRELGRELGPKPDRELGPKPDRELARQLAQERAHHDACRAALAAMTEGADERVVNGENAFASGADAEVLGYQLRSWAKELRDMPQGPLFFGRLDFDACADADHAGQSYHIGRRRISEHPFAPPLVVDWRAPVSRRFYQASARDPQGVEVRRRFGWARGSLGAAEDLTGLEDERLTAGEAHRTSAILAGEIERPRVGPMRDIAATIQPEQDDLVRSELARSICVQGAPGTGKTAVGLHRAAYLLYTHPQRLQRRGLLVLGPNRTFLSYVCEVLPALGESGIRQSTVDEEVARGTRGREVRAVDAPETARVKHDARMAEVLRRALYGRVAHPVNSLALREGSMTWRVSRDELASIVASVRAEAPPYAIGRERVRSRAVRAIQLQAERRAGPMNNTWLQKITRARPVTEYVDTVWPRVKPEEVLADLLTDPEALASAAEGVLDGAEQQALLWAGPPRSWKSARWSAADLILLDEVSGLIEHPEGYGHIVVDEAQDLSPMQCRAIARRAVFGSLTVLGDLAQGTTPWAARDWRRQLAHLGKPDAVVVPLTTGFRVPAAIVELANRLLPALDVDVPPGRSLRGDGRLSHRLAATPEGLAAEVVEAVRAALRGEGSVGVIAADHEVPALRAALAAAGFDASGAARVALLPATLAKGLEYDHVVAVEPAEIAASEERGLHRLYVVLTRAVSGLDIVHSRPLPSELA
ncbi:DNA helicase IV [Streptomyces hundungensis]|uniref:DNA helicase IV n=1 Tax=Streptomyces hundungensis TaxID=1077946 RepID=A0A387HM71_9ACTN|nr:AAA family ATPase [Streptomyces hundungensis]AYG84599.1 DNA helicase IV [Streptomyces hundungensis]